MSRNFNLYFGSRLSVNIADSIYFIGILWIIQSLGNESILTGVTYAALSVTGLFAIFIGDVIDKKGPNLMCRITVLAQAILIGILTFSLVVGFNNMAFLISMVLIASIFSNVFYPASNTLLAILVKDVKDLNKANTLVQSSDQVINLSGYLLGGVLISYLGSKYTLGLASLLLFISFIGFNMLRMQSNSNKLTEQEEIQKNKLLIIKNGFQTIIGNVLIRNLLLVTLISGLFVAVMIVLLPSLAAEYGSAIYYSFFYVSFFIGFIIGAISSNFINFTGLNFSLLWIGNGLSLLPLIFINHWIGICAGILLYGFFSGIVNIHLMTLLQKSVQKDQLGKVLSVFTSVNAIATTVGALIGGIIVHYFTIQIIGFIGLTLLSLCGILLFSQEKIRKFQMQDIEDKPGLRQAE